jgi:hypothetical protein
MRLATCEHGAEHEETGKRMSSTPTETGTAAGRGNGSEHARIRQLRRRTLKGGFATTE